MRALHADLEAVKWLALVSMAVDHTGKVVLWWWLEETHAFGRLALPLFVWILAVRLAHDASLGPRRYVPKLLVYGALAQPAYQIVSGMRELDVLFTLAAAVLVEAGTRPGPWRGRLGLLAVFAMPWVEFPLIVVGVPVLVRLARVSLGGSAVLAGGLAFLANGVPGPMDVGMAAPALLAGPIGWGLLRYGPALPRLPGWVFYGFYPGHLFLLAAWYTWVL